MFHLINIGISIFILAGRKNDSLTILRKIKFPEMVVRSKKGKLTSNRSLPESLPPTEVSASQHSLRVYLQITYWKITRYKTKNATEWGCKTAKDHLEPVMTEQVSLVFCK